jgi:hypothetical protein
MFRLRMDFIGHPSEACGMNLACSRFDFSYELG